MGDYISPFFIDYIIPPILLFLTYTINKTGMNSLEKIV